MWYINHPNCNADMGGPRGEEDKVETLRIKDVSVGHFGSRQMTSYWLPNAEDLKILNAGGSVALTIFAPRHPVISMAVEKKP